MIFCWCRSKKNEERPAPTTRSEKKVDVHEVSTAGSEETRPQVCASQAHQQSVKQEYDRPAYNPVEVVRHESGSAASSTNSRLGMGPVGSRNSTVTSTHTLNTTQRVYSAGERKCVRLKLAERTVSVPGDFHKAPVGADVLFNQDGRWITGVVSELYSEGTCDIEYGRNRAVQHGVRPDYIKTPDAMYTAKCLQGRWYDGARATWDVQDLNVRETQPNGIIMIKALCHVGESGLLALDGVKVHAVTNERVVWADGVVWRRARGKEVIMPIEDVSVQWGQSPTGVVVTSAAKGAPVSDREVLHSVDGVSISSLECFTKYIVAATAPTLRLVVCPPLPHPPIPAPFFDTGGVQEGDTAAALWGGAYHPCCIRSSRVCKDPGSSEDCIYSVQWTFFDPPEDIVARARPGSVEGGCWENTSISMREAGAASQGLLAEDIRQRYKRAYESYLKLCVLATEASETASPMGSMKSSTPKFSNGVANGANGMHHFDCAVSANGGDQGGFATRQSDSNDTQPTCLTFSDLICCLRLTKLTARQHLKELVRACNQEVPLRDWMLWLGHLSEQGRAEAVLAWIESHIDGSKPMPPPSAECPSPTTQYPPTTECVLLLPGRGKVVGECGSVAREGEAFTTNEVGTLVQGTLVDICEVVGRRAKVVAPIEGWVSLTTADGDMLISEHAVMPGVDEGDLIHCDGETSGCSWQAGVLERVDDSSPASRGCIRRFIGRELLSVNGEAVGKMDINQILSRNTFSRLSFRPLNSLVAVLRKRPDESMGLHFVEHNVLQSVTEHSVGDRADFQRFLGKTVTHIDGRPVKTLSDIMLLSRGVTSVSFTFTDDSRPELADTVHTISDLAAAGSPATQLQPYDLDALPSIADLVGVCIEGTEGEDGQEALPEAGYAYDDDGQGAEVGPGGAPGVSEVESVEKDGEVQCMPSRAHNPF